MNEKEERYFDMKRLGDAIDLGDDRNGCHHIKKVVVYSGDDDSIVDAIEITQNRMGEININPKNPTEIDSIFHRPRELNLIIDLKDENKQTKKLHITVNKGQVFYAVLY